MKPLSSNSCSWLDNSCISECARRYGDRATGADPGTSRSGTRLVLVAVNQDEVNGREATPVSLKNKMCMVEVRHYVKGRDPQISVEQLMLQVCIGTDSGTGSACCDTKIGN
ncbi:hypothetical protein L1987_24822 [Smallanthus sonchifolius]|uniref:Uncharacterized protein n=1 Tax=Smallanthus sonchifolius TaxID=185202 RepID=A0ACB9ILG7_9ASTR|nr:hypothetical protein L1987_24822 [Smallanthus sonchifolius]